MSRFDRTQFFCFFLKSNHHALSALENMKCSQSIRFIKQSASNASFRLSEEHSKYTRAHPCMSEDEYSPKKKTNQRNWLDQQQQKLFANIFFWVNADREKIRRMAIDEWNDIQHKVKEQVELSRFYLGQNYRQKNVEEKNWNEICVCVVCVCVCYTPIRRI